MVQACSVVRSFSHLKFKNVSNLKTVLDVIRNILSKTRDTSFLIQEILVFKEDEVPVFKEAALALEFLLTRQTKGLLTLFHIKHVYDEVVMWVT